MGRILPECLSGCLWPNLLPEDSGVKVTELKQMKLFPGKAFTPDFADFSGSVSLHLASKQMQVLDHGFKRSAGVGHSELLLLTTHRRELSLALCMLHFFIQLFHGRQDRVHLPLTQTLSETPGAALGLSPFKSFLASNARHPCPCHVSAWDADGHAAHKSFLQCLHFPACAGLS